MEAHNPYFLNQKFFTPLFFKIVERIDFFDISKWWKSFSSKKRGKKPVSVVKTFALKNMECQLSFAPQINKKTFTETRKDSLIQILVEENACFGKCVFYRFRRLWSTFEAYNLFENSGTSQKVMLQDLFFMLSGWDMVSKCA